MKAVLVAVGLGERTAARPVWHSPGWPWATVDRPPVDQAIEAFARAGFEEVAVVLGHSEDVLWHYLEDGARYGIVVYCLLNAQHTRGSATALYTAQAFVGGEPFVVWLSGYPVSASMLLTLRAQVSGRHGVCINRQTRHSRQGRGVMRVRLDQQGRVCQVGQRLKHWHALSAGTLLFQPEVFGHISALLLRRAKDCSIGALLRRMIASGEAPYAYDVSSMLEGAQARDELMLWTAPMLSVRFAGAVGGMLVN